MGTGSETVVIPDCRAAASPQSRHVDMDSGLLAGMTGWQAPPRRATDQADDNYTLAMRNDDLKGAP